MKVLGPSVMHSDLTTRLVNNYKWIIQRTVTDSYPVPTVKHTLTKFEEKTICSTFEITKTFFNVKVDPEEQCFKKCLDMIKYVDDITLASSADDDGHSRNKGRIKL